MKDKFESPIEKVLLMSAESGGMDAEYAEPIRGNDIFNKVGDVDIDKCTSELLVDDFLCEESIRHAENVAKFLINCRDETATAMEINLDKDRSVDDFDAYIMDLVARTEYLLSRVRKAIDLEDGGGIELNDCDIKDVYLQYKKIESYADTLSKVKIIDADGKYNNKILVMLREMAAEMYNGFKVIESLDDDVTKVVIRGTGDDCIPDGFYNNEDADNKSDKSHEWEISELIRIGVGVDDEYFEDEIKRLAIGILNGHRDIAFKIHSYTKRIDNLPGEPNKYAIDKLPKYKQLECLLRGVFEITRSCVSVAVAKNQIIDLSILENSMEEYEDEDDDALMFSYFSKLPA